MNQTNYHKAPTRQVAVALKRQPALPLCAEVIEECKKSGLNSIRLDFPDTVSDSKPRLWLDAPLFKEALQSLIHDTAYQRKESEYVTVSLREGMNTCFISILYKLRKPIDARIMGTGESLRFVSIRTREIITQHRTKINLNAINMRASIEMSFEK